MFCPKCGQNQTSEAMRFCSRCGFPLTGVMVLLATDGVIVEGVRPETSVLREIMSRFGTKLIILSLLLLPFALIACSIVRSPGPIAIPVILALIGFVHFAFVHFARERTLARQQELTLIDRTPDQGPLPPPRFVPILATGINANDTAEIIQPPSVTESTTRLLEREPPQ